MSPPTYRVRRATLDDLAALKTLWTSMRFSADDLEKRLTEFQVVASDQGRVIGAIGIELQQQHALLHNEAYEDFALADEVRPLLLERIRSLASNHGVFRLWTREKAPFWTHHGFQPAGAEVLPKLPPAWGSAGQDWLTLQLKDEAALVSLEKELAMYMESEKQRTAKTMQQAHTLKSIATFAAILLALFILAVVIFVMLKNPPGLNPVR